MFRVLHVRLILLAALVVLALTPSWALTVLSPTPDQTVREDVKIVVAGSDVPEGGFVALLLKEGDQQRFVVGMERDSGIDPALARSLDESNRLAGDILQQKIRDYSQLQRLTKQLQPILRAAAGKGDPGLGQTVQKLQNSISHGGTVDVQAAKNLLDSGELKKLISSKLIFRWNSKATYRDPSQPSEDKTYKDGRYALVIEIHDAGGKLADSATVNVTLQNKVPRSNPAPAVSLVNKLAFGQSNTYKIHADVQIFHMVSGVGLPILGGMGMTSDFKVLQNVEDVRPDGELLVRYRMDPDAVINSFGKKVRVYAAEAPKPQLYRVVDKYGNVINRNVFTKQAKFAIMDVLPALPGRPVKEGDSWPTAIDLKIEGITSVVPLTGTSMLDSFEWQNGQECAKIISSKLTGLSVISMNGGKIRSSTTDVGAQMVTYFAYKTGRAVRREITLRFPALVLAGAEDFDPGAADANGAVSSPAPRTVTPAQLTRGYDPTGPDDDETGGGSSGPMPSRRSRTPGDTSSPDANTKKGEVQLNVVVTLEK